MTEEKMIEEILYESHSVGMRREVMDEPFNMISWVLKILRIEELIGVSNCI